MLLFAMVALLLAVAEPERSFTACAPPQDVKVFHKDANWWLDDAGKKTVADVALYARTHPRTQISVSSRYHYRGNTAVATVADALSEQGVRAFYVTITSGPLGGDRSIPAPPEAYMETSIEFYCAS